MNELEEAVIKAAQNWRYGVIDARVLMEAVDDLDESRKPDPWKIIERVKREVDNTGYTTAKTMERIGRALEWRRTHE